ncbi:ATP-binding protein [Sporosarcina sp. FSL K6-1522]|uniref:ATP-binding protein n=1 Tax=Sporosarcina sp. FSL K6-1522 TaxID=2921554 RepID=UPI00315A27C1
MESIADVMSRLNSTRMDLTSEICYEHETLVRGNPVRKEVRKILFDGELLCPMCENNKNTKQLENLETEKALFATNRKNYMVLNNQSLVKDKTLLDASFKSFLAIGDEESEEHVNKERAKTAVKHYRSGKVFNTMLIGDPGVGKSHLAMSIIRNLNETDDKQRTCLFIDIDEMFSRVRDSFSNRESKYTERYFIQLLSSVDYLVLDDLGAETGSTDTDNGASNYTIRILKSIGDSRQDKSTIFTTNLSRAALAKMYDAKTVSRLLRDTYLIKFENTTDKRIRNIEF